MARVSALESMVRKPAQKAFEARASLSLLRLSHGQRGRIAGLVAATGMLANLAALTGQIIAAGTLSIAVGVTPAHAMTCSFNSPSMSTTVTYTAATMGTDQTASESTTINCPSSYGNGGAYILQSCAYVIYSGNSVTNNNSYSLPVNITMGYGTITMPQYGFSAQPAYVTNPASGTFYYYISNLWSSITIAESPSFNNMFTVTMPGSSTTNLPNPGTYSNIYQYHWSNGFMPSGQNACSTWPDPSPLTFTANFVIPPICNVSSVSNVNFGTVSSLATRQDATGSIAVACSQGIPYTIYLGDGNQRQSPGSGLRQMNSGSNLLPYQLYQDSGRTTVWDSTGGTSSVGGSGGVSGTGTGTAANTPVYASIPAGTTLPTPGSYGDTVVITVAY